ncbi:hypothetical protein OC834_006471 [Tilletia horrida]|nr:hypothetical protein OC834_006471 [Tilletia horrida]
MNEVKAIQDQGQHKTPEGSKRILDLHKQADEAAMGMHNVQAEANAEAAREEQRRLGQAPLRSTMNFRLLSALVVSALLLASVTAAPLITEDASAASSAAAALHLHSLAERAGAAFDPDLLPSIIEEIAHGQGLQYIEQMRELQSLLNSGEHTLPGGMQRVHQLLAQAQTTATGMSAAQVEAEIAQLMAERQAARREAQRLARQRNARNQS